MFKFYVLSARQLPHTFCVAPLLAVSLTTHGELPYPAEVGLWSRAAGRRPPRVMKLAQPPSLLSWKHSVRRPQALHAFGVVPRTRQPGRTLAARAATPPHPSSSVTAGEGRRAKPAWCRRRCDLPYPYTRGFARGRRGGRRRCTSHVALMLVPDLGQAAPVPAALGSMARAALIHLGRSW
jgi:hypothetical protein